MINIEQKRQYQRDWIKARKAAKLKNFGPCVFCWSDQNIEIHHIDQESKESHKIWSWEESRLDMELSKCVPLCKSCHDKLHGLLRRRPIKHGTISGYVNHRCRCEACKKARADYRKKTDN